MTAIHANCPACGDVTLRHADIKVRICSDNDARTYNFRCPACGWRVVKETTKMIVDLLVSSGCKLEIWRMPAELNEFHNGPELRPDDLLDFHLLLQEDDWFDQLATMVQRTNTI